jgi:hypothetical protein
MYSTHESSKTDCFLRFDRETILRLLVDIFAQDQIPKAQNLGPDLEATRDSHDIKKKN